MRTGDLRIGNYVYVRMEKYPPDRPYRIEAIYSYMVMLRDMEKDETIECSTPNLMGIPMTESLLLQIGINKHLTKNHLLLGDMLVAGMENHKLTLFAYDEDDHEYLKLMEIKYLHQLQNIYSACTGMELSVKL